MGDFNRAIPDATLSAPSCPKGRDCLRDGFRPDQDPYRHPSHELDRLSLRRAGRSGCAAGRRPGRVRERGTPEAVEAARVEYLGQKHGRLKAAQERLKSLEPATAGYGQRFNAAKAELEAACEAAKSRVERRGMPRGAST